MFDKSIYLRPIEHDKGVEQSEFKAYLLDNYKTSDSENGDIKGIAEALGFDNHMLSKVDYFVELENHVQLIELSDLQDDFRRCAVEIADALKIINEDSKSKNTWKTEQKKKAKNKAWQSLRDEFQKKWYGSIATIERLYRKTKQPVDADPQYSLLIVCKNETDTKMLDELNTEFGGLLNGQCGKVKQVQVCKTDQLHKYLLS